MLSLKDKKDCRWDLVSLGEVLLRFDPGDDRIHNAVNFRVFDGGGEYNVARGLAKVFRQKTAVVTALVDNALGRLADNLIAQGGVDASEIIWREDDGIGANARNGIYYIERGFGVRPPTSSFDRANTAVSQLKPGDIDWQKIFAVEKTRWFHTGGIFAGLSESAAAVALEAAKIAGENGVIVSYDLNYRDSLWKNRGGREAADDLNAKILPFADVVFGIPKFVSSFKDFDENSFKRAAANLQKELPNLKVIASTLRETISASEHHLGAAVFAENEVFKSRDYRNVSIFDRVGSGDAFASGFIYGLLNDLGLPFAVECGAAHSVLAMTTPGDNSMARLNEIEALIKGGPASVVR